MGKFKEEFLKEVLKFNDNEVELVLECQKLFPELLVNEAKTIKSAKSLYLELGLNKAVWRRWSQTNIIENEFFKENVDWIGFNTMLNGNESIDFSISVDFAKHLVMQSKSKKSHKFRTYFILIEKAIKGRQDHISIREPEKENYNKMKEEIIKKYSNEHSVVSKNDESYLMVRESNMINVALTGYRACDIKIKLGYDDIQTREHLIIEQNKAIDYLQSVIQGLVIAGVGFEERSKIVENICKNKYPHLRMDNKELVNV